MSNSSPASAPDEEPSEPLLKRHFKPVLIGLGMVFLVVYFGILPRFRTPPEIDALRTYVMRQVSHERLHLLNCTLENIAVDDSLVTATAHVSGVRRAATGYAKVETGLTPPPPAFDLAKWKYLRQLVESPGGSRRLELAALDPEAHGLATATVVGEIPLREHPVSFPVVVRAERTGFRWVFSVTTTDSYQQAIKPGRFPPLAEFTGEVLVVQRAQDQERIATLNRRMPEIVETLERAAAAFAAEQMPAVLKLIQPGTLFAGTVSSTRPLTAKPFRVSLEITELSVEKGSPRFSALIHNDGGGTDKRIFAGRVEVAPATGGLQLRLASPAHMGARDLGPLLQDRYDEIQLDRDENGNALLQLIVDDEALLGQGRRYHVHLERVPENRRESVRSEITGADRTLSAATAPGTVYTGTITDRVTGTKEPALLRFVERPEPLVGVAAILQHPGRVAWRTQFRGAYTANRYQRLAPAPIELYRAFSPTGDPPNEMLERFGLTEQGVPFFLDVDGARLVGEAERFVYRFEPASPEVVAEYARRAGARDAVLRAFITPGAIHQGTVERDGVAGSGRVRLRFDTTPGSNRHDSSLPETKARTVYAVMHATDEPRYASRMKGTTDHLADSQILLALEQPPHWPAGGLDDAPSLAAQLQHVGLHPGEFVLSLEENDVVGIIESGDSVVRLRFSPSTAEQIAQFQREDSAARDLLRNFVQAGGKHEGSIMREGTSNTPAPIRLLLIQFNERTRFVQAALESTTPAGPRLPLQGRYDPTTGVLALRRSNEPLAAETDLARDPRIKPHLTDGAGYDEFGFFVQAGRIIGRSNSLAGEAVTLVFEGMASKEP